MFKIMIIVLYALSGPKTMHVTDKEFVHEQECLVFLEEWEDQLMDYAHNEGLTDPALHENFILDVRGSCIEGAEW